VFISTIIQKNTPSCRFRGSTEVVFVDHQRESLQNQWQTSAYTTRIIKSLSSGRCVLLSL